MPLHHFRQVFVHATNLRASVTDHCEIPGARQNLKRPSRFGWPDSASHVSRRTYGWRQSAELIFGEILRGVGRRDASAVSIASRARSNVRASLAGTGLHFPGTKFEGNITLITGRCPSSMTFTVHRRKSGAQSAKKGYIITRSARSTALECAVARSLASLPMLS